MGRSIIREGVEIKTIPILGVFLVIDGAPTMEKLVYIEKHN